MKLFDWVISDNDPRQNNHLSQIGYSTLKSPHIMHNASQLRHFVINSLAFELFTTESYIFKSNIWSSYITLDKPKVTKGIVIRKTRQISFIDQFIAETVLFKVVLPRTVADDVSVYRITS